MWSMFVVIETIYAKCCVTLLLRDSAGNYLTSNQTISKHLEEISLLVYTFVSSQHGLVKTQ